MKKWKSVKMTKEELDFHIKARKAGRVFKDKKKYNKSDRRKNKVF